MKIVILILSFPFLFLMSASSQEKKIFDVKKTFCLDFNDDVDTTVLGGVGDKEGIKLNLYYLNECSGGIFFDIEPMRNTVSVKNGKAVSFRAYIGFDEIPELKKKIGKYSNCKIKIGFTQSNYKNYWYAELTPIISKKK